MTRVAIVDYGLCNLDSIQRAVLECGGDPYLVHHAAGLDDADRIILPGVGSFAQAITNLTESGLTQAIPRAVDRQCPLLGICLGMHLLAETSSEGGNTAGLGLLAGAVMPLQPVNGERVPHIGWNDVATTTPSPLFAGIADATDFYFVHGYRLDSPAEQTLATVDYCGKTTVAAQRENVMAVQFHPEKSQSAGFRLLKNFLDY